MSVLRLRAALLVPALAWVGLSAQSARAGGTPVGFVSLPACATLAVVDLPTGGTIARIHVPAGPAAVAASMNGRRVLVASPSTGAVTEIDGVHHRVIRTFRGFDRPVRVAFDYEPPVGIVTPRYAFVLERTHGTLAVLDLVRGRVAARLRIGAQPQDLAVDGATIWITHAGDGTIARVDVTSPTRPRLLPSVVARGEVTALVADSNLRSVFVARGRSGNVARYVDGDGRARLAYSIRASRAPLSGLAVAAPDLLIDTDRHGLLTTMREATGKEVSRLRGSPETRSLDAYGGWLVAILPRGLSLVGARNGSMRESVPFGSLVDGFAWSIL